MGLVVGEVLEVAVVVAVVAVVAVGVLWVLVVVGPVCFSRKTVVKLRQRTLLTRRRTTPALR